MKPKFKEGDKVRYVKTGAIGWESADWAAVIGDVGDCFVIDKVISDTKIEVEESGMVIHPGHFELVESSTINTKDLYSNVAGQGIVCGDTRIERALRKKDQEDQYKISYVEAAFSSAVVKHSDIPALVAALLDIYDGNVKEEELPF